MQFAGKPLEWAIAGLSPRGLFAWIRAAAFACTWPGWTGMSPSTGVQKLVAWDGHSDEVDDSKALTIWKRADGTHQILRYRD